MDGLRLARGRRVDHERRAIRVTGVVQGVGFRPATYRLADELGLAGFVRNDADGVFIEVEGAPSNLDLFIGKLPDAAPGVARVDRVETTPVEARYDREFRIETSREADSGPRIVATGADRATCADCLCELLDPG